MLRQRRRIKLECKATIGFSSTSSQGVLPEEPSTGPARAAVAAKFCRDTTTGVRPGDPRGHVDARPKNENRHQMGSGAEYLSPRPKSNATFAVARRQTVRTAKSVRSSSFLCAGTPHWRGACRKIACVERSSEGNLGSSAQGSKRNQPNGHATLRGKFVLLSYRYAFTRSVRSFW